MKKIIFTIAIVVGVLISFFQTIRIYDTYYVPKIIVSENVVESSPSPLMERRLEAMEIPDSLSGDSVRVVIIPEEHVEDSTVVPERSDPVISEQGHYIPSDTALQVEFWVDIITSLASAIAPILVPFIIYRKKGEE